MSLPEDFTKHRAIRAVVVLSLICSVMGVVPHLVFSWHLGEPAFWQGAWDESFYLLALYGEIPAWNSYPLKRALAWAVAAFEPSKIAFATIADAVLPAIVTVSAGVLALAVFRAQAAVLILTFCLVFGSDIFGLNSSVVLFSGITLNSVLIDLSLYQRQFFSDAFANYLHVFRTPEPQLSLSFLFLHLAVLVLFVSEPERRGKLLVPFAITSALCSLIYSFFSLAALSGSGAAALALLISRDRIRILPFILIAAAGIAATVMVIVSGYSNEADSVLFQARTPMLSPAVLYGLLGVLWIGLRHGSRLFSSPVLLFSVALLLFPLAALNQQVVTGIMIQTLNWERYVNIPFVLIGLATAARVGGRSGNQIQRLMSAARTNWQCIEQVFKTVATGRPRDRSAPDTGQLHQVRCPRRALARSLIPAMLVLALLFIGQAQLRTYQHFLYYNVRMQGYSEAADRALQLDSSRDIQIILDSMQYDATIRVRGDRIQDELAGYSWIVTTAMAELLRNPVSTDLPTQGYRIAAGLGLSVDTYRERLQRELDGAYCWPHLMYLAPFLECAPYVSDFRRYDPAALQDIVDRSMTGYAAYLAHPESQHDAPALILSSAPLDFTDASRHWKTEFLFETETAVGSNALLPAASAKVYTYRQTLDGTAGN